MRVRALTSLLALALVASIAPDAQAQQIRQYGGDSANESSGGGGGGGGQQRFYYPGQPVPQSSGNSQSGQAQSQPAAQQQQKSEDGEGVEESYAIRIYQPGDYDQQSGQTQQQAQVPDPVGKSHDKIYRGVIPGMRDTVAHLQQAAATSRSGPNPVTWIGFRAEDERTRVFIQTARSPTFSRHASDDDTKLTIEIGNSELSERNFARRIDASQYKRVVERVRAREQSDGTVAVDIELRSAESPDISTSGRYLYVDFPRPSADEQDESGSNDSSESPSTGDSQ